MILDARNEFCDNVSAALTAGTWTNVGNQIPLGVARDIGSGEPLYLVVAVGSTGIKVGALTGTFEVRLASDDSATIHASTSTVHIVSAAVATSTTSDAGVLAPGTVLLAVALPMEGSAYEEYIGVQAKATSENTTAGTINAFLTHDVAKWVPYADGI